MISASPGPLETFREAALSQHPQIRRLQALGEQAGEGVKVQEAKLKPQLYAFGQYDLHRDDALITDSDWAFGIGLRYTFFSGNNRPRQIAAARAQQFQAEAGLREVRNQITIGVSKAYNDLLSARQQYLLLDSSLELARESLRLQELSFREGQVTSLDVIDAQLRLGATLVERVQAAYEYDVALARLLEISGQLDHYQNYFRQADKVLEQ